MSEPNYGFIKLDRKILGWKWTTQPVTFSVFVHLLLMASYEDNEFCGEIIKRGQINTTYQKIAIATGCKVSSIRHALSNLKLTGEVTITRKYRYIVITITKYDEYQSPITLSDTYNTCNLTGKVTSRQQLLNNSKNSKNKEEKPPKPPRGGKPPSGEKQWDNLHAETMMPRDMGTYDDIPSVYRDGTYQSFKTWEEYWDWSNQ